MLYVMKNHRTGFKDNENVFEYVLFNSDNSTKATFEGKAKDMKTVAKFFKIEGIAPSVAYRKKMLNYKVVESNEFLAL